jgi:hypothetical protein
MRPPHPPCLSTHWRDQQLAEPRVRSSCNSFKSARVALPSRGELIDISNGLLDAGAGHLLAECGRNGTPTESTGLVPASACNEGGRLATGKRHKLISAANIPKDQEAEIGPDAKPATGTRVAPLDQGDRLRVGCVGRAWRRHKGWRRFAKNSSNTRMTELIERRSVGRMSQRRAVDRSGFTCAAGIRPNQRQT